MRLSKSVGFCNFFNQKSKKTMTQKQLDYWKERGSLLDRFNADKTATENDFERQRDVKTISLCTLTKVSLFTLAQWKSKYTLLLKHKDRFFFIALDCTWADQRNLKGSGLRYNYTPDNSYTLYVYDGDYSRLLYSKKVFQIVDEFSAITDDIEKELRHYLDYFIQEVDKITNKILHKKKK